MEKKTTSNYFKIPPRETKSFGVQKMPEVREAKSKAQYFHGDKLPNNLSLHKNFLNAAQKPKIVSEAMTPEKKKEQDFFDKMDAYKIEGEQIRQRHKKQDAELEKKWAEWEKKNNTGK